MMAAFAFVLTNPAHHLVYYYEGGTSHRGPCILVLYAVAAYYCAFGIGWLLRWRQAFDSSEFSILMMLSYMLLSSGLLYFILFQLAVSNKQTLPLDQKLTGKAQVENGHQLIFELVGMTLPLILVMLLLLAFEEDTCYMILLAIGIVLTALHPLWLRHVYVRMMKRKYKNLEGFHSSR
jgi:Kef-type K+ transport system membrane component KefB